MIQLRHFIYLAIVFTATMVTVAKARQVSASTESITKVRSGASIKDLHVMTRYKSEQTTTLQDNQSKVFIATLCEQCKGQTITGNVTLYSNYDWNPNKGVVYFYIVDDLKKTEKDSLCSNTKHGSTSAVANCTISSFRSTSNALYLVARSGRYRVDFSVSIDIGATNSMKENLKEMKTRKVQVKSNYSLHLENVAIEFLTEVITSENTEILNVAETGLLSATFCPNPQTNIYNIRSIVISEDDESSFAQYICVTLPCTVDSPNVIAENMGTGPINEVVVGPEYVRKLQLYVLIVCRSGKPNPDVPSGSTGEFRYYADIEPIQ